MLKLAFQLLLAALPCLLLGQRQYLEATITTNDGNKLTGKIAVENWIKSPRAIEFTSGGGSQKAYRVADLSGFSVVGHGGQKLYYERKEVDIEVSSHILSELETTPELHYQRDTAWLQLIYQGAWKLFTFTSITGKQHFFVEPDGSNPKELVRKLWKNDYKIESVDLYRKQLLELTQDCPTAQKMLLAGDWGPKPGERLLEKGLLSFCKTVDECAGSKASYLLFAEKSKMTGQVLLGAHLSSYNFNPASNREISGVSGYQLGFGFNYFFRKSNKRTAFYNEVIFYNDNKKSDTHITFGTQNFISIIDYRSSQIGISNTVSFKISKLSIMPAIKIGMAHRLGLNWDITERTGYINSIDNAPTYDKHYYKRFYEFGPTIGLSGQYKRIGLDIRIANTYTTGYFGLSKKPSSQYLALSLSYQVF